ncbi:MAG: oxidoreductase, partial [Pseudomonadota bacterium]
RALVLEPSLPDLWRAGRMPEPAFPRFAEAPEGGITAWYTMRLADLAHEAETGGIADAKAALEAYDARDAQRTAVWQRHFADRALLPTD